MMKDTKGMFRRLKRRLAKQEHQRQPDCLKTD